MLAGKDWKDFQSCFITGAQVVRWREMYDFFENVGVWWCGGGGWFPLAFEQSKVCTLCDFGHLQCFNEP
jgi:hypothetical protein